jgi:predicted MPP superfamily phosphohydrolase
MIKKFPKIGYNHYFAIIILLGLLNVSLGYMYWEGKTNDITTLDVQGAPGRIVFIADPHLREGNMDHIQESITQINELHPAFVLIGGDFTYGDDLSLQDVWRGIDAPVYAVLGNHDYQTGITATSCVQKMLSIKEATIEVDHYNVSCLRDDSVDEAYADQLTAILEKNGVHVLRNEYADIAIGGKTVRIVGMDDGWAGLANPPSVPDTDAFTIYLIHEPECQADWKADLILSGHTHGGQFIPPGADRLLSGGRIELSGLIEGKNATSYVTRGLSTSNLEFEVRAFASPEIVLIESPDVS